MIKLKKKTIITIAITTGVFIGFCSFAFINLGKWLLVKDPLPEKLDMIFVFAGTSPLRELYGCQLLKRFSNSKIIISSPTEYKRVISWAVNDSVDTTRIQPFPVCRSTWKELVALRIKLKSHSADNTLNVGLVSCPYHMRRIKIFSQSIFKKNFILHYLPVPFEKFPHPREHFIHWWRRFHIIKYVFSEYSKIIIYIIPSIFHLIIKS